MKSSKLFIVMIAAAMMFVSCASVTKQEVYPELYEEAPVSVLVMPPINMSTEVELKDNFYSTLAVPLADAGYYVFPQFMSMEILQRESAYDSEMFIDRSAKIFNDYFGADMVLYTKILDATKSVIGSSVTIKVEYIVKSAKTDTVLIHKTVRVSQDTSANMSGGGLVGLLAKVAVSAVKTATTDFIKLARDGNSLAFNDIPNGKYHPEYLQDKDTKISPATSESLYK